MPEILPHPRHADQRIFLLAISSRAAADAGDKPIITVTGTDGTEDRHGSVISPDGWDLKAFRANPVVTWSHQDDLIPSIGRAPNIRRVGGAWDFDIEFATEQWRDYGSGNLSALVYRLMKDDYLRAVSPAFIPKAFEDREAQTIPTFFAENLRYLKQELTAISPCNVGSNRNALKKAITDHVISENEATLLGLGTMLRVEMPIIVATRKPAEQPKPSVDKAAAFRANVAAIVKRCCGDGPYYADEMEPVSPEVQAAEITLINDLAADLLEDINIALTGWTISEHDELRDICSSRVAGGMYLYDRLAMLLERWYGQAIGATIPDINFTDMQTVAAKAPEAFTRAAAMFADTTKLDEILAIVTELRSKPVHKSGEPESRQDSTTPTMIRIATDASSGREEEESSTPERPTMYRVLLAD